MNKNPITSAFERAHQALGFHDLQAPGADVPHARMSVPAVASTTIDLTRALVAFQGKDTYRVDALPAGKTIDLSATVIQRSRVAMAGTRIFIAAEKHSPQALENAFFSDIGLVRTIDPAPFGSVADGASAVAVALPFHDVLLKWADAPSIAVSFDVSRRKQKDAGGGEQLEHDLLAAILDGLALAADKALLTAIMAANPTAFSFGAAAARNLAFSDLRGLVGTTGAGANIAADGTLRAGGVAAELTAGMAGTVVGAFGRAAVAIRPELHLHVRRLDANGNMNATVFASLQALLPDAGAFWKVV